MLLTNFQNIPIDYCHRILCIPHFYTLDTILVGCKILTSTLFTLGNVRITCHLRERLAHQLRCFEGTDHFLGYVTSRVRTDVDR